MRILLDKDTPVQLVEVLRHLLPRHRIDHIRNLGWAGKKDRAVAIKKSGLHHIRYSQRQKGLRGLALSMGAVISSMPAIVEDLDAASRQQLVEIQALEPRGRYKVVDPAKEPPRYWR